LPQNSAAWQNRHNFAAFQNKLSVQEKFWFVTMQRNEEDHVNRKRIFCKNNFTGDYKDLPLFANLAKFYLL
jgi:hypothetical protein